MLILYETLAGQRLVVEQASPEPWRNKRPISVSAVFFGPGIDIWRTCWVFWGGVSSRPEETADSRVLDSPLRLFGYAVGSATELFLVPLS